MLRSFRGQLSSATPSTLCSTALLLAMPLPLLDQNLPHPPQQAPVIRPLQRPQARATPVIGRPGLAYALTPERRALLNTIRYAEGTWKGGNTAGYRTLYGGSTFSSLARHPRITVTRRYTSAAAGAYQFLPQTWDEASQRLRLSDFSPASQDQAALYLVERRGVLEAVDQQGLSRAVMARLAREWASFPAAHGGSHYGQPVKDAEDLQRFYAANLSAQRRSPA
jgi:muramidase (phage lysozyme)